MLFLWASSHGFGLLTAIRAVRDATVRAGIDPAEILIDMPLQVQCHSCRAEDCAMSLAANLRVDILPY